MNLFPLYYSTAYNQLGDLYKQMSTNQDTNAIASTIDHFQNDLDHLFYDWNTIHILLESIRNAFTVEENLTEEHLNEVDRELSIAYDDLMSQVRHLERRLKRMTNEINQKLIVQQQQQWDLHLGTLTPGVTSYQNE